MPLISPEETEVGKAGVIWLSESKKENKSLDPETLRKQICVAGHPET